MNDSYERSYYEIALTNSQVLSALAILLLCLLASFVAGMWVAREAVSPVAVQTAEMVPEQASAPEGGEAEFRFFRRLGGGDKTSAGSAPSAVVGNEPAVEELRGDGAVRGDGLVRTVSPVEVAAAAPDKKPQTQQPPPLATKSPSKEPQRQTATNVQSPTPKRDPVQSVASPAPRDVDEERKLGSMVVVQVLSSADQEKAGKVVVQLKDSGYRAFLSPALVEGRTMYRVRVGPYADRAQAEQASEKIKSQFRLNTWITARG